MKSTRKTTPVVALLALCLALSAPMPVSAEEVDSSIAACLKTWGDHPFGNNPRFKTLGTSLKVFGIGTRTADTEHSSSPSLVLVNPIINLVGGTTIDLLNPNGWYCMKTMVSLIGPVHIRAHCKAQLAATSDGNTVLGNNTGNQPIKNLSVTVIGAVSIDRPCD